MPPTQTVFRSGEDVVSQLALFNVSKEELREVGIAAANARREAGDYFPVSAPGLLSWIHGVAKLNRLFVSKGWEQRRNENLECVSDPDSGRTIYFVNAARAGDPLLEPKSSNDRGPASQRAVDAAQPFLFKELEKKYAINDDQLLLWVLFVAVTEEGVSIELSCPKPMLDGKYAGFHRRILVAEPGELKDIINLEPDESEYQWESSVQVTPK